MADSSTIVTRMAGAGCDGKGEERKTLPRFSPSHHTLRATREVVRDDWERVRLSGANMYPVTHLIPLGVNKTPFRAGTQALVLVHQLRLCLLESI